MVGIDETAPRDMPTQTRLPAVRAIKLAFLAAGFVSLVLSVTLWFMGYREEGLFVGLWVPAVHSLGALVLAPER